MADVKRVNLLVFGWNSCIFKIDGEDFEGIQALDYEQGRERKKVMGSRRDARPLGKTSGKYEVKNVSFTLLRDSAAKLKAQLATKAGGKSYGDAEFSIQAQYVEPNQDPITVSIEGCTWSGEKMSDKEGVDELLTEVTVDALYMTENGLALWAQDEGTA